MKKDLFNKYCEIAKKTGDTNIINMVDTFSPFSELVNYLGENPTEKDLIDFYQEISKES